MHRLEHQVMTKTILTLSTTLVLLTHCSTLNRHDLVATETLGQIGRETFIYAVYQLDYDAFDIVFSVVVDNDTSELCNVNIADGVYSKNSFQVEFIQDTLVIFNQRQTKTLYFQTKGESIVKLTGRH